MTVEHDSVIDMNQVISIRGPDIYQPSIHASIIEKQEYACSFENPKKAKHKGRPKGSSFTQQVLQDLDVGTSRSTKQANIETNDSNIKLKPGIWYC
ncbi:13397_t:CDS:2, partial [Racocetra persica]